MTDVGGIAGDQLRSYIERIERLNEEEAAIKDDKREVFAEAKGNGFDPKIMRQVIAARKIDPDDRAERETLFDLYMRAISETGTARANHAQARIPREAPATPHDSDGVAIETAAPTPTEPNTSARSIEGAEGYPSTPSPDEVLPADVTASSESGQPLKPSREIGVTEDIPAFLRRQKVAAE